MLKSKSVMGFGIFLGLVLLASTASAALNYTWEAETDTNWTNPDNWNGSLGVPGAGVTAYFADMGLTDVTVDSNSVEIKAIEFEVNVQDFTFYDNQIKLTAGGVNPPMKTNDVGIQTFNNPINYTYPYGGGRLGTFNGGSHIVFNGLLTYSSTPCAVYGDGYTIDIAGGFYLNRSASYCIFENRGQGTINWKSEIDGLNNFHIYAYDGRINYYVDLPDYGTSGNYGVRSIFIWTSTTSTPSMYLSADGVSLPLIFMDEYPISSSSGSSLVGVDIPDGGGSANLMTLALDGNSDTFYIDAQEDDTLVIDVVVKQINGFQGSFNNVLRKTGPGTVIINDGGADNAADNIAEYHVDAGVLALASPADLALIDTPTPGAVMSVHSGGKLRFDSSQQQIPETMPVSLDGGAISTGAGAGSSQTLGTLAVAGSSIISLGTGTHDLTFADSSSVSWTGNLTIKGWFGTASQSGDNGRVLFSGAGLTSQQLSSITFEGFDPGAKFIGNEIVPISGQPIPTDCGDPGTIYLAGDVDLNCYVNMIDLDLLVNQWLETTCEAPLWCDGADLNTDNSVDFEDFVDIAATWMQCTHPQDIECIPY